MDYTIKDHLYCIIASHFGLCVVFYSFFDSSMDLVFLEIENHDFAFCILHAPAHAQFRIVVDCPKLSRYKFDIAMGLLPRRYFYTPTLSGFDSADAGHRHGSIGCDAVRRGDL